MTIRDIAIAFGYEVDAKSEKKVNESIDKLKSTATKALGAIGIGFSLVKVKQVIEEFGKINTQIKNATKGLCEQKEIQNEIINAANAARMAYGDIAEVTSKLVQNNRDLFDVTSASKYAELTAKLFKSEGKNQSDILSLQQEINKSFSKGAVDAGTINQIIEKSPAAADLLAKKVGVARTELTKMASDGKISLEQLRDAFLGNAETIEAAFANVDLTISDALLNIRNQWGLWLTQMDSTLGVTKTIAKFMTRAFNQIMNALKKVQTWTERVVKVFGGAEKLLKMIAIAGGAIFVALNAGKILSFLRNMSSLLNVANLKFLGIALVIALVALLIEDFINFMQVKDSLLGEMLKMAGIDADAVREKIISAWNTIKDFLGKTWEFLKRIATTIWGGLKAFWSEHSDKIKETLIAAWGAIKAALEAAWKALKVITFVIFNALKSFWETWGSTILAIFGDIWKLIGKNFDAALDALKGIFNLFAAIFTGDWESAWNAIKDIVSAVWDAIANSFTTAKDIIVKVFDKLYDVVGGFAAVIAGITAAIVAYKVATAAMAIVQGIMAGATSGLTVAQIAQAVAAKAVAAAQWLLNAAMSANPIGIVIALIAGLVAAFVVLWNKSEGFRNFFIGMWEGIKKAFGSVVDWFKKNWQSLILFLINPVAGIFKYLYDNFEGFRNIVDKVVGAIKKFFADLWNNIKQGLSAIAAFFKSIWDSIVGFFKAIWGFLVNIVKTYVAVWQTIFKAVAGFFKSIWENIKKFFSAIWDFFVGIVKTNVAMWQSIFAAVGNFFRAIWDAIVNFFKTIWDILTDSTMSAGEKIKAIFKAVGDFFTTIWNAVVSFFVAIWDTITATVTNAGEIIKGVFAAVGDFFTGVWDGIKSVFNTVTDFFGGVFTNAADAIKSAFSGIKDFFSNLFQAVANVVKAPINGIISGINGVLGGLNKITIPYWVPGIGGKGLNFPTIPQLAKGGVLKKGQTGYLEGNGAEAVVPLEKNTGWIKKVAELFKAQLPTKDDGGESGVIAAVKSIGGVVGNAIKTVSEKVSNAKANADSSGLTDAIRSFGANIATLAKGATASPSTVQSMVTSTTNRSVTQNNYFESTFNGDRAGQKRSSEAMNKNANDATGELARALAYSR